MCGRYAITLPPEAVRQHFDYLDQPNFPQRFNIAPTQPVPVVRPEESARRFVLMRWGFIPGFVKDPKTFPLVINVRSETIRDKPSFRAAFKRRRCLMPADGFYEWHRVGKVSQPYLFRRPDGGPFGFAAISETWSSPDGSEIDTVAMATTHANGLMAAIHDRCPVILSPADHERWLDPMASPEDVESLLRPPPDDALEMIPVGVAVNKVGNDGPDLQVRQRVSQPEPTVPRSRGKPPDGQTSLF